MFSFQGKCANCEAQAEVECNMCPAAQAKFCRACFATAHALPCFQSHQEEELGPIRLADAVLRKVVALAAGAQLR